MKNKRVGIITIGLGLIPLAITSALISDSVHNNIQACLIGITAFSLLGSFICIFIAIEDWYTE